MSPDKEVFLPGHSHFCFKHEVYECILPPAYDYLRRFQVEEYDLES